VKTINGEAQLHALVDSKKRIITESSVRRDLKLEDEEGMIRNLDNMSGKFLMYPRFIQVFLNQQLDGLPTHKRIYIMAHLSTAKKIFGNMRRVGKGFSGRVTPLFPTMVVQNQSELGEDTKTRKPQKEGHSGYRQHRDPSEELVADEVVHEGVELALPSKRETRERHFGGLPLLLLP
ncbi:hypothetical protein Tco_0385315, partial [Tanacetum coccineum]